MKPMICNFRRRPQTWVTKPFVTCFLLVAVLASGCVSTKYKKAQRDTPPATRLDIAFPSAEVAAMLNSVITFDGPGSWKRNALWDEYVVTIRNLRPEPIQIVVAELFDYSNTMRTARDEPWALEKESKTLERQFKDTGIAFVRYSAPGALIFYSGVAAAAIPGVLYTTAAYAVVVALPVYYGSVLVINRKNRKGIESEFNQRRLTLPMMLGPGEVRTGSLFFPMVPSPRSLSFRWTAGAHGGEWALPLSFLEGLHIKQR